MIISNRSRSHTLHSGHVCESFSVEAATLRIRIQATTDRSSARGPGFRSFSQLIRPWRDARRRVPNKYGARRRVPLQVVLLVLSALYAFAENPEMAMDKMSDNELRAFREQKVAELKGRVRDARHEQ